MDLNATGVTIKKDVIVQEPSKFDNVDMHPARRDNELYCDYKCRMWWVNRIKKFYLKGRPIWKGHMGTKYGSFKTT